MSASKSKPAGKPMAWTPALVKMLRGKRTLSEFGELISAPKNTVWRWEAGYVAPGTMHSAKLSEIARKEQFLSDWQLAGSVEIVSDLEQGSKQIALTMQESLARSARKLGS